MELQGIAIGVGRKFVNILVTISLPGFKPVVYSQVDESM